MLDITLNIYKKPHGEGGTATMPRHWLERAIPSEVSDFSQQPHQRGSATTSPPPEWVWGEAYEMLEQGADDGAADGWAARCAVTSDEEAAEAASGSRSSAVARAADWSVDDADP